MEPVVYESNTSPKSMWDTGYSQETHSVQTTPKERLRTVEEFIDKLEQAVFERL